MSSVELRAVAADEAELRLDRWFRRHFPALGHGRLQKLLRTGQIRLDGQRVEANARLALGQTIRVPPQAVLGGQDRATFPPARRSPADALRLEEMILFQDETLVVLNKPSGLAVQGGTGTSRHLDGMLAAWRPKERPRLVHRLDRDTSGLLVVARTASAAAELTRAFRRHQVDKLYWALVVGRPTVGRGIVDRPLAKQPGSRGERVGPDEEGRAARTAYRVVARAGKVASWLALRPLTGRTHQLRAHCALLGTPIVGDFKYGGAAARLAGAPKGLMLHARELRLAHPKGGRLAFTAPLSPEIEAGFAWLGFEPD
ncbi:MAG: RluA family pseudouridine synthase, partial [Geminicoccales bacterium]